MYPLETTIRLFLSDLDTVADQMWVVPLLLKS